MSKIIVIVGPTNVGKTKLSIELAKIYNCDIINADSMQFYKGLDIGTAKIKEEEQEGIKHHLLDILNVEDDYSIYHYQRDGRKIIDDLLAQNKNIIIVGGTGLYIKALLYDYKLNKSIINDTYDNISTDNLYQELVRLDKDIKIDKNNRRRIIRAINYYKENNKSINTNVTDKLLYDAIFIGLNTNRELLYNKINNRVDDMIKEGLIDEVKSFYDKKIYARPLISGIGYKELYEYFDGKVSLEEAILNIKQNSRRYAKRQLTFFRNKLDVKWFNTNYSDFNKTVLEVYNYISGVDGDETI